ncbi:MAG TPA: YjbE family putative metal transport protein [Rhizomicrobium sp.]|jgi:YjbE family integral membrane protein|nr:YjbE family putative metal transport protein [Rhizomicrobium sp.]
MDLPTLHILPPALAALLQVILIDIVLAGDNAVVIGVSAARVPESDRRRVMFWGLAAAVILRLIVAYAVLLLLRTTFFLAFAGGVLLLWVAWRLYREIRPVPDEHRLGIETISGLNLNTSHVRLPGASPDVRRAVFRIAVADLSMSLDNVLAVAGAAMNHVWVLAVGLLLSIALMGLAASLIANLLHKMPWISYAGVIIVLYVALRMMWIGAMQIYYAV